MLDAICFTTELPRQKLEPVTSTLTIPSNCAITDLVIMHLLPVFYRAQEIFRSGLDSPILRMTVKRSIESNAADPRTSATSCKFDSTFLLLFVRTLLFYN